MSTKRNINLKFPKGSFLYSIGEEALGSFEKDFTRVIDDAQRIVVISDTIEDSHAALDIERHLVNAGLAIDSYSLPRGQKAKTLEQVNNIVEQMVQSGVTSDDIVLAIGGIEISDVAGYIAGTFMGGMKLVCVPTTLEAAILIPGRSFALNVGERDNALSVEHVPSLAVCDFATFNSAGMKTMRNGYAVLVQRALIDTRYAFEKLNEMAEEIVKGDSYALLNAIVRATETASRIAMAVEKSTTNISNRNLDFGTTFGKALEFAYGKGTISRGDVLAEGMRFEAIMSVDVFETESTEFVGKLNKTLTDFNLPLRAGDKTAPFLLACLKETGLNRSNKIWFALPKMPGDIEITDVEDDLLEENLKAYAISRKKLLEKERIERRELRRQQTEARLKREAEIKANREAEKAKALASDEKEQIEKASHLESEPAIETSEGDE